MEPDDTKQGSSLAGFVTTAVFALFGLLLINLHGPHFEFDSSNYLIIADQFSQGNLDRIGELAPLMPWMVGFLKLLFQDMMFSINLYLLLVWLLLFFTLRIALHAGPFAMAFALVFLFVNPDTAFHVTQFMTELGFSALVLTAVLALGVPEFCCRRTGNFFVRHREGIFLVTLAMIPMQRYIGGFLAVYLAIIYLIQSTSLQNAQARLMKLATAATPFAVVLYWNYLITAKFGGFRDEVEADLLTNWNLLWQTVTENYLFETVIYIAAFAVLLVVFWVRRNERTLLRSLALFLLLLVPAVQLLIQVVSSANFHADEMNSRYLVVVLPLVGAFAITAIAWLSKAAARRAPIFKARFLSETAWLAAVSALIVYNEWPGQFYYASLHDVSKRPDLSRMLGQPDMESIAVAEGWDGEKIVYASDILTGRLTYGLPCHSYEVKGSIHLTGIEFIPDCDDVGYPVFRPIAFEAWESVPPGTDGLLYRYSYKPHELADTMVRLMPSCATVAEPADQVYSYYQYFPYYLFFDLRSCKFED